MPVTGAPAPSTAAAQNAGAPLAVRSVIDGDTLTLTDGRRVRLAQVDAPETTACFGSRAREGLRRLVEGQTITVRGPENGPERDRYGRTLGEVAVDGRSVNEQFVRDGVARWYDEFAAEDADLARRLRAAQSDAHKAARGLWAACQRATPSSAAPPPGPALAQPGAKCHPAYPHDCIPAAPPDLDCPDIKRQVQVVRTHGDPTGSMPTVGWGCQSYG